MLEVLHTLPIIVQWAFLCFVVNLVCSLKTFVATIEVVWEINKQVQ